MHSFQHIISQRILRLLASHLLLLAMSLHLASLIPLDSSASEGALFPLVPNVIFLLLTLLAYHFVAGYYEDTPRRGRLELVIRGLTASATAWVLFSAAAFWVPALQLNPFTKLVGIGLGTIGLIGSRLLFASQWSERLLFLGATPVANRLISELEVGHPGYEILGYVDDQPQGGVLSNGYRILGTTQELSEVVARSRTSTIIVALAERRGAFPMEAVMDCKLRGVRIEDWPAFYENLTGKIAVRSLRPSWLIFSEGFLRTRFIRIAKRWMDVLLSISLLVGGMPIWLLVVLLIKLDSHGPVFYQQERVGERGRPFNLLKFRTMAHNAESLTGPVWAAEEDPRITRIGRWLRKIRLDEFPQILNVLKGEMGFVGPRPERPCFVAQLQEKIPYYSQRHTVKPGITGWAQVRYRYGATIEDAEEKLQYDLYYIKNMSLFLDALILLASIRTVLAGSGAR